MGLKTSSKGQAAAEYLILTGLLFVIVAAVFLYASSTSRESLQLNKTRTSVKNLQNAADEVYSLGPGSRLTARIEVPPIVEDFILEGNEIGYKIRVRDSETDVYEQTKGIVVGKLPLKQGIYDVIVEMTDAGTVRIGSGLIISPSLSYLQGDFDEIIVKQYTIENTIGDPLTSVSLQVTGALKDYSVVTPNLFDLAVQEKRTFSVSAVIPETYIYNYTGYIEADSNQGYNDLSKINLLINQQVKSMYLTFYSDDGYTVIEDLFSQGDTIYYTVELYDLIGRPINTDDLNVIIEDPSHSTETIGNQTTPNGTYYGTFLVEDTDPLGEWLITSKTRKYGAIQVEGFIVVG